MEKRMEAAAEFLGDKYCPVCGKRFTVLWPHLWSYKRGKPNTKYYCSWKCLRKLDKEAEEAEMERKHIINKEIREKAVQMALNGEDPKPYLKDCGCNNPAKAWGNIRQRVKTEDPKTYEALLQKPGKAKESEPAEEFMEKCQELDLKVNEKYPVKKLAEGSDLKPIAWRGKIGKYIYDEKNNIIDFDTDLETISLSVDGWRIFLKVFKAAAQLMGVDL